MIYYLVVWISRREELQQVELEESEILEQLSEKFASPTSRQTIKILNT